MSSSLLAQSRNSSAPIPGCPNFRWGEVTRNGQRPLPNEQTAQNALRVARILQEIRNQVKAPIHVTSWYRDPASNAAAGGVSNSRHLSGDAVDFYVDHLSPAQLYAICDRIVGSRGGVGRYSHNQIVHVDARGTRARW